jgi:4-amino-4-deoxychorismate lyase
LNGAILNREYHSLRFKQSYQNFYWKRPEFDLFEGIEIPHNHKNGRFKLRISYNQNDKNHTLQPYQERRINSLKIVHNDAIDYALKFEDRSLLNSLFEKRMQCDDILIVKNGWLTDSLYANLSLWDGQKWYTPKTCLLKGTKRMKLLETKEIQEASLQLKDLKKFIGFQLINAMLDFRPDVFLPIKNIEP